METVGNVVKRKPLHWQIAAQIRERISNGSYNADELPRELSLAEEFAVSRHTIRSALQHLVNEGLIERRAGAGTWVTDRARSGVWAIGALNDLIGEFTPDQFLTISAGDEPAKRFEAAAEMLKLAKSDMLFHVLRVLMRTNQPYALANVYCRSEHAAAVPAELMGSERLILLLERYAKVRATRARQSASATAADISAARQLGIDPGSPVLVLKRTYFDADDVVILHTDVLCRPDRYEQVVDFVHEPAGVRGEDQ